MLFNINDYLKKILVINFREMEKNIPLRWYDFLKKASYGDYQFSEFIHSTGEKYSFCFDKYLSVYNAFFSSLDSEEKTIFLNSI
jgi:hypothetical protein